MGRFVRIVSCLALMGSARAGAALKAASPAEVCASLKSLGLATGGWKQQYDTFTCASPYKVLGSGALPNSLAFYAEGTKTKVDQVKLVLNVNVPASAAAAHGELMKAAQALCLAVAGTPLPPDATAAIKGGKKAATKVGASVVSVLRDDWPTGKGYELQVVVR